MSTARLAEEKKERERREKLREGEKESRHAHMPDDMPKTPHVDGLTSATRSIDITAHITRERD